MAASRKHPATVWRDALLSETDNPLTPTARLVGMALAVWVSEDGYAWPSVARLARQTGLSERSVRQQVHALETAGYIALARRGGGRQGGQYATNRWVVTIPEPDSGLRDERDAGLEALTPEPRSVSPERGSTRGEPRSVSPEPPSPELEKELETELDPELAASLDVCPDCGEDNGSPHRPVETDDGDARWCRYSPRGQQAQKVREIRAQAVAV